MRSELGESVTSYISRLANAHSVSCSKLMRKMIAPLMAGGRLKSRARASDLFRTTGNSFNGFGVASRRSVEALMLLTHEPRIRDLNLQFLEGYVFGQGMLKTIQAWCPECLFDWQRNQEQLYLPLAWNISAFRVCPFHQVYLVDRCPHCSAQRPALNRLQQLGHCPACHQFLGTPSESPDRPPTYPWDLAASAMVLDLLNQGRERLRRLPFNGFSQNVKSILNRHFSGNQAKMAAILNIDRFTIRKWTAGEQLPKLGYFLWLAYRFGQRPIDLLTVNGVSPESFCVRSFGDESNDAFIRFKVRPSKNAIVGTMLDSLIVNPEDPPPSLATIAKRLETHITSISTQFPKQAAILKQRHKTYREGKKDQRERAEVDAITKAVAKLHEAGVYPSLSKTRQKLVGSRMLCNPDLANHWRRLIRDLGYRDPSGAI